MNQRIFLIALSALLLTGTASAEVYKCRTADGRVEIANIPCPAGANTLKTAPDERVSEASRQQAEREVERMRDYVEKREAAQRADQAAEQGRQNEQIRSTAGSSPGNLRSIDDCLRDLDRQALTPMQRAQMESACRSLQPNQPVYVPVPVSTFGGNPIDRCIENIERQNLSPDERSRRIRQCESSYALPGQPAPLPKPPVAPPPAPAPGKSLSAPSTACLPGTNCLRR